VGGKKNEEKIKRDQERQESEVLSTADVREAGV
jgi:hypothetical protein